MEQPIKSAKFITSVALGSTPQKINPLPEIAVAGKSNVGKSSFINALTNHNKLARTSGAPGRTRLVNYFELRYGDKEAFHLVDLPGYGYAAVSRAEKEKWGPLIEGYLRGSQQLKLLLLLVDIRHDPGQNDLQMNDWIRAMKLPYLVVATKSDKIGKSQWHRRRMDLAFHLKLDMLEQIQPFSSLNRQGIQGVWQQMEKVLSPQHEDPSIDHESAIR